MTYASIDLVDGLANFLSTVENDTSYWETRDRPPSREKRVLIAVRYKSVCQGLCSPDDYVFRNECSRICNIRSISSKRMGKHSSLGRRTFPRQRLRLPYATLPAERHPAWGHATTAQRATYSKTIKKDLTSVMLENVPSLAVTRHPTWQSNTGEPQ